MKKLMMAVAIVCAAAFAQAANVSWSISNVASTYKTGNMLVYAFIGDVTSAAATALASTTESDWTSFLNPGATGKTISKRGSANGTLEGFDSPDLSGCVKSGNYVQKFLFGVHSFSVLLEITFGHHIRSSLHLE